MEFTQLYKQSRGLVQSTALPKDETLIATCYQSKLIIRDRESLEIVAQTQLKSAITGMQLCGQLVVCWSTADGWIEVLTLKNGEQVARLEPGDFVHCKLLNGTHMLVFAPCGMRISVVDLQTRLVTMLPLYKSVSTSMQCSNGRFFTYVTRQDGGDSVSVINCQLGEWRIIQSVKMQFEVLKLQWCPDGVHFIVGDYTKFQVYRIDGKLAGGCTLFDYLQDSLDAILQLTWSPRGQVMAACSLRTVHIVANLSFKRVYSFQLAASDSHLSETLCTADKENTRFKLVPKPAGKQEDILPSMFVATAKESVLKLQYMPLDSVTVAWHQNGMHLAVVSSYMPNSVSFLDVNSCRVMVVLSHLTAVSAKALVW